MMQTRRKACCETGPLVAAEGQGINVIRLGPVSVAVSSTP
jgi:hypothetical protein